MSCRVCSRSDHDAIDAQLFRGVSLRSIVAHFPGTTLGTLHRHSKHFAANTATGGRQRVRERSERASELQRRAESLLRAAMSTLRIANKKNDTKGAVLAITASTKLIETLGKLTGDLGPGALRVAHAQPAVEENQDEIDQVELATIFQRVTKNFDAAEIMKLRAIADAENARFPILQTNTELHADCTEEQIPAASTESNS